MNIVVMNRVKVYIYMTAMMLIIGLFGHFLSQAFNWGLTGTGSFILGAGIINFIAYFFSDKLILRAARARLLEREQVPQLFSIIEEIIREQHLPMPKVYLVDDDSMNAFATGRNPKHSAIAVTRGLLEKLGPAEVKGVVGHELAHIKNWDMLLMTVIAISAGFISILADAYWNSRLMQNAQEKDKSGILGIISLVLAIFAPIAAMLIQLAISRQREFLADATSAKMTSDGFSLASALEKIGRDRRPLPGMGASTAHLCFSSPMREGGLIDKLFSTHPPIEDRIKSLTGKAA